MCFLCSDEFAVVNDAARRRHILDLLAIIEHADALPNSAALRLSREIMTLLGSCTDRLRCDPIEPDAVAGETR